MRLGCGQAQLVGGALELLADGEAFFRVALRLVLVQRLQALANS